METSGPNSNFAPVIRLPPKRKSNSMHSEIFEPKDCLVSDTLYLSKLPVNIKEVDIRTILQHCLPTEIFFDRDNDTGYLRFNQPKYADKAYTLYNGFTFTNNSKLELQMYKEKRLDLEPTAALLEVKNLPDYFDDNKLYHLFRPFGPISFCKCVINNNHFNGTAIIQYFYPYNSDQAITNMDGSLLEGNTLIVVPCKTSKLQQPLPQPQQKEENNIDMLNLYIKNIDPNITNYELNQAFRRFGKIISARVMTNPTTHQSKGYGFVSFSKSDEAAFALHEMNGCMLGNKPIIVAYHEPKKGNRTQQQQQQPQPQLQSHLQQPQQQHQHQQHQQHQHQQQQHYDNYYYQQQSNTRYISSPTPINGLGIDSVDELGMNDMPMNQKPVNNTAVNLPLQKKKDHKLSPQFSASPISGTSTGKSLASLASGLSIQQPPQKAIERPTLRRRGSLESVMTESTANLQRVKLEEAVKNFGYYGNTLNDIVDMLLTLRRKERSLCLFNSDFLNEKIQLALDALATCLDDSESDQDEDQADFMMKRPIKHQIIEPIVYSPKEPKGISSPKTSEVLGDKDIESLLISMEGKATHEKKQLLGDQLFPLVKSTGTKQAPKVTICLLDTIDLIDLVHIMYDTQLLKARVEEAFLSLQH